MKKSILVFRICREGFEKMIKNNKIEPKYREMKKFWISRFLEKNGEFKKFDEVHIINGYQKTSPIAKTKITNITEEEIDGKKFFKIEFDNILEVENYPSV